MPERTDRWIRSRRESTAGRGASRARLAYAAIGAATALLGPPEAHGGAGPQGATIYLNDCLPDGCTLTAGFESSINNTSSIITGTRQLTGFSHGPELWAELVDCVREVWSPFDVEFVDVDPAPAAHLEHIIAGTPQQLGMQSGTGGVSPFNCNFIPNSISFTFDVWGPDLHDLCWTAAQEIAHQFGLDHEAFKPDPMTYIEGCGRKDFSDVVAPCGEHTPRACLCGGKTQNSYARLSELAGTTDFLFAGTFEDVDDDWICDWSAQEPPPAEVAELWPPAIDAGRPRCVTLDPERLERQGFVPPAR